jgi:XTP/dITP diphosphohydrolase
MTEPAPQHPKLDELIAVLATLRAPGGCAWDREQTHESLVQYLLEETWELVDAIESGTRDELIEELGDVLYQVIFHADIAAHDPARSFTIEDVASQMTAKMIGRHPHVFGDAVAETANDVGTLWDEVKAVEKSSRTSVIDGIPQRMPSLLLAAKLVGRAERVGIAGPEAGSGQAELSDRTSPTDETELGARLLELVTVARARGLDAERALRMTLRGLEDDIRRAESLSEPRE